MRKSLKFFHRAVMGLVGITHATFAFSCQDNYYEKCAWLACICLPNSGALQSVVPVVPLVLAAPFVSSLVVSTAPKAVEDIAATLQKTLDNTGKTLVKAAADARRELDIAGKGAESNVSRLGRDIEAETGRFGLELESVGVALVKGSKSLEQGATQTVRAAEQRIREGKVIDAIWHEALAPIQVFEKATSVAVLESSYVRGVGQVAATAYGGSAGAAAYAAWLTYRQTGDASLALRVGILTGATSALNGEAKLIDGAVQRAVVTGAIGGAAVAAAGGNEQAVREAFLLASASVVVQDGMKAFTGFDPSGKAAEGDAYCLAPTERDCTPLPPGAAIGLDEKGNYLVAMDKIDPRVPVVGKKDLTALFNEGNAVMTGVSRVPGMQAMAVFHDNWAISWDMGALTTPVTILPAIVLTYVGLGSPYYERLQKTAVEHALNPSLPCCASSISMAEEQAVRQGVEKTYVHFDAKGGTKSVYLIYGPGDWCKGPEEVLVKPKPTKTSGGVSISSKYGSCLRKDQLLNGMRVRPNSPQPSDFACRVILVHKDVSTTLQESLYDFKGCDAALHKQLGRASNRKNSAIWYEATASQLRPTRLISKN